MVNRRAASVSSGAPAKSASSFKFGFTSATPSLNAAAVHAGMASTPRLVQVKVTILRDLTPFAPLLTQQQNGRIARLPDELFDKWFESTGTIMLNTLPVQYSPQRRAVDASERGAGGF